jgi:2-amino-4-hydroxy-6-hydroxymethyldihydropteridine diphosphokinase
VVEVIVALGSNLGDRLDNLRRAIEAIARETKLTDYSSVYETEPMYQEDQGPFLNCVIALETNMSPRTLMGLLKAVEEEIGRERTGPRYGPRTIDLDILFFGDEVISEPFLEIPHPRIAERAFVLVPLKEIRPTLVDPASKATVTEMLDLLTTDKGVVKKPELSFGRAESQPRRS